MHEHPEIQPQQSQPRREEISRENRPWPVSLVVGAVLFGMILAGGIQLAPLTFAESGGTAVRVDPSEISPGLPGFADLAEAVSPAVVSIRATKFSDAPDVRRMDPFDFLIPRRRQEDNNREREEREPEQRRADSSGSGFVISGDGLIITNHHVIEDASELAVFLEGREYKAEVIGDDPATDIALLKIDPIEPLSYLELGDSETLRVGDWIMVIGSPLQLQNSVSVGVVSAKGRSINITPDASLESFIQTDAAINFGNSGGPLVDLQGRVVGIATAINFGAENIGFAVPVSILETILPQLRDNGVVKRGYLGVNIQNLDHRRAKAFGLDSTDGALVTQVTRDSPAEDAGFEHGDIILEVDGRKITDTRSLIDYVSSKPPGEEVAVELYRNGKKISKSLTLGERPTQGDARPMIEPEEEEEPEEGKIEWLGISFQDVTPGYRESHQLGRDVDGVLLTNVEATSPLYEENVRAGDLIVEVNGEAVDAASDFSRIVDDAESGDFIRLYVRRYDPRSGEAIASFFAFVEAP